MSAEFRGECLGRHTLGFKILSFSLPGSPSGRRAFPSSPVRCWLLCLLPRLSSSCRRAWKIRNCVQHPSELQLPSLPPSCDGVLSGWNQKRSVLPSSAGGSKRPARRPHAHVRPKLRLRREELNEEMRKLQSHVRSRGAIDRDSSQDWEDDAAFSVWQADWVARNSSCDAEQPDELWGARARQDRASLAKVSRSLHPYSLARLTVTQEAVQGAKLIAPGSAKLLRPWQEISCPETLSMKLRQRETSGRQGGQTSV
eukprot:766305-Hanusia_phi.AAC.6